MRARRLAILVVLCSCYDEADMSYASRDSLGAVGHSSPASATPLAALPSIGSTASQLQAARPNARFSAYTGFVESSNGGTVTYQFAEGVTETRIAPSAVVSMVTYAQTFPLGSTAVARFHSAAEQLAIQFGPPDECGQILGSTVDVSARWRSGRPHVELAVRGPMTRGDAPGVVLEFVTSGSLPRLAGQKVDCSLVLDPR